MKLTDDKILDLARVERGKNYDSFFSWAISEKHMLNFARAVLKEAGVEELERDRKRLEYLAKSGAQILCGVPGFYLYWHTSGRCSPAAGSIKEAIDEAMKAK